MSGHGSAQPPSDENDYFESLFEWTRRKHDILERYVSVFPKIKGSLYCIDAFAGRGQHHDGNNGSPLVTASVAQRFRDNDKAYWLRCINVERNPEYFQTLVELTAAYPPDLVQNIQGDFAGYLTYILSKVGQNPALFFLDPFGVEGIEWERIKPILVREQTTELLINFNVRYVPRLAGHLYSGAAAAAAKTKLLTDVLGTDQWKQYVASDKSLTDTGQVLSSTDRIAELYKNQLRRHFRYVFHYPIRSAADGHVRYFLMFATRSSKGVSVMNDILCGTEEQFQEDVQNLRPKPSAEQLSLFGAIENEANAQELSSEDIIASRVGQLQSAIWNALQSAPLGRLSYLDLRCLLAEQFFAKVKKKTYSQALRDLLREGKIDWPKSDSRLPDDNEIIRKLI